MRWPSDRAMYNRVFPTDQALITNVLFNQGYRRFQVTVWPDHDTKYQAVVWCKDPEVIPPFWGRRGAGVVIEPLPLTSFRGNVIGAGYGGYAGDIILTDEMVEEEQVRYEAASRSDGGETAPRNGDPDQDVASNGVGDYPEEWSSDGA